MLAWNEAAGTGMRSLLKATAPELAMLGLLPLHRHSPHCRLHADVENTLLAHLEGTPLAGNMSRFRTASMVMNVVNFHCFRACAFKGMEPYTVSRSTTLRVCIGVGPHPILVFNPQAEPTAWQGHAWAPGFLGSGELSWDSMG